MTRGAKKIPLEQYALLGLSPGCSPEALDAAVRKLLEQHENNKAMREAIGLASAIIIMHEHARWDMKKNP